jgi:indole-3-glycerol phosphate synthase
MILDEILAETRLEVARRKARVSPLEMERLSLAAPPCGAAANRSLAESLGRPGIRCISEIKRRSPSVGWICENADPVAIAKAYRDAGAAAISVLTDGPFFGGSLDDLRAVRAAVQTPLLRKDFMVDGYQVAEARLAGADAILLIVAALDDGELKQLHDEADRLGLDVLVEAHTEEEVARAVALGARIVGVNHRDLRTFKVDTTLAIRMRNAVPAGTLLVAESGIRDRSDVARMQAGGIDAILVGESLMKTADPGEALAELLGPFNP